MKGLPDSLKNIYTKVGDTMLITKIEPQKNPDRINVYIDGKFAFGILKEIQLKYSLDENMEIDKDFIKDVLLEEEKLKAKNKALRFLSYQRRSTKEVKDKLEREGFETFIIEETIAYLKSYNLLDDLEYAKAFMEAKARQNKYGPERIKFELYKKGIPREIIDKVLEEYPDEYSIAYNLALKKKKTYKTNDRRVLYGKLGNFLQQKGFTYDCILRVLEDILE